MTSTAKPPNCGFPVEAPMAFGALLGLESGISYTATARDDHPGQVPTAEKPLGYGVLMWIKANP